MTTRRTPLRALLPVTAALLAVCALVVGVVAVTAVGYQNATCDNAVLRESVCPDGRRKVVVFQRDCGATTGFSTQASILSADAPTPRTSGNLFVSDTDHGRAPAGGGGGPEVRVRWLSRDAIVIAHHELARVFLKVSQLDGVTVAYDTFGDEPAVQQGVAPDDWSPSAPTRR